jgi:hypothetical protein
MKKKHQMTPDERERFERERVRGSDELKREWMPARERAFAHEQDRDGDGLPDGPAKRRVPS